MRLSILSVLAGAVPVAAAVLIGLALSRPSKPQVQDAGAQPFVAAGLAPILEAPPQLQWPQLRGPTGQGVVPAGRFPASWNAKADQNILWRTAVPLPGNSSPVIWGDRIFLTGADRNERRVFCFGRNSGILLWSAPVRTRAVLPADFEAHQETGLASPTPVVDGRCVYAFFGTNEMAAVDFFGRPLWARWFGVPESSYGIATSPRIFNGRIILQLDQGQDSAEAKSFLYAIDPLNGKDVWKTPRNVPSSWTTPIVVNTGKRDELITCANPWVISYDPATGKELWRAEILSGDVAPLPVYADGIVYVNTEYAKLAAIRTGDGGDVTETNVLWKYEEDLSDVASPVTDGKFLILPTGAGFLTCFDAKTGKVLWKQEFHDGFWSSPTIVGNLVYLTDRAGKTHIFELADKYNLIGAGTIDETVYSTPAFMDSKIYIRGKENLYCIGLRNEESKGQKP